MEEGYVDPYKDTIVKLIVKQVLGALATKLPFLASGPGGWIVSQILFWVVPKLLENTIMGVNLVWIGVENKKAVDTLNRLLEDSKEVQTSEERENLEKAIDDEFADLVNLVKRRL